MSIKKEARHFFTKYKRNNIKRKESLMEDPMLHRGTRDPTII